MIQNLARMPGPGDLPGDSSNPNSPDYVEPAFGLDDAAGNVADRLVKAGDVGELVDTMAEASGALEWIVRNVALPQQHRAAFNFLRAECARMDRMRDAEYDALNGEAA